MQEVNKDREVLNDLIKINNDRVEGYQKAIKETKESDNDLRVLFNRMADESLKYAEELKVHFTKLGESADGQTTIPGKVYRAWMDIKTAASGNSRASVLSACEFGEDAAQEHYKEALNSKEISSSLRDVLSNQQRVLKSSHDTIKELRDKEQNSKMAQGL